MICKKDVIQWFKELESYKRIDTMCTLLNMCLPFELRFLGTCLEELGRRDSQELRGMELRVNNPQDLATDMVACQKGEPTDKKIRRKMALYLALIRACNRTCVTEIFRTLDGWGDRDFVNMNDPDTLQELLLVYTMAANHPVFSFDQQCKCTHIFEKIKENKLVSDHQASQPPLLEQSLVHAQYQPDHRQHMPQSHQEIMQPHVLHPQAMHLAGQPHPALLSPANMMPHIPMTFSQGIHKLIPADGAIQHPVSVDTHMIVIPTESSPIYNQNWPRMYTQSVEHPPQSASPLLSQQSSPSSSRTTSPNRNSTTNMIQQSMQIQPQQQIRNIPQRMNASLKNVRRPSAETTPPPVGQQHQIIHEMNMASNVKHIEDGVTGNDGLVTPLQALIRNGYPRRQKTGNYTPLLHQQQQQLSVNPHFQPATNFSVNNSIPYSMQSMSLSDVSGGGIHTMDATLVGTAINSNKSGGSDSGSSNGSCGEVSPPATPTISNAVTNMPGLRLSVEQQQVHHSKHQQPQISYNKQTISTRLNGRSDKLLSANAIGVSNVSTVASGMYTAPMPNPLQPLSQPQSQPMFGADIILATGGNAGAVGLMQTSLASNNNSGVGSNIAVVNSTSNVGSSNNNIASNPVLISSPSGVASGGGGIITNINPNPIILPSPQQQYNGAYPYHLAPNPQHQRIITHAPPPHLYSYYSIPSGAPPVTLRTTNTAPTNTNVTGASGVIQVQPQQSSQTLAASQAIPSPAILAATPYNPQSAPVVNNKHISCYNCGSQNHSGPDCQEASMEDVTRSAVYKLDYSASSNATPTVVAGSTNIPVVAGGNGGTSDSLQIQHHQQQHHQKHSIESSGGSNIIGTASTGTGVQSTAVVSAVNTK